MNPETPETIQFGTIHLTFQPETDEKPYPSYYGEIGFVHVKVDYSWNNTWTGRLSSAKGRLIITSQVKKTPQEAAQELLEYAKEIIHEIAFVVFP